MEISRTRLALAVMGSVLAPFIIVPIILVDFDIIHVPLFKTFPLTFFIILFLSVLMIVMPKFVGDEKSKNDLKYAPYYGISMMLGAFGMVRIELLSFLCSVLGTIIFVIAIIMEFKNKAGIFS